MSRPNSPLSPAQVKPSSKAESPAKRNASVSPSGRLERSPSPAKHKKFSESDFESKRESIDPELRKKQLQAKLRGLKLEPKDWTRQELFEKMTNYFTIIFENSISSKLGSSPLRSVGSSSNVAREIHVLNGVKLTNDEITIFNEFCRRNTELKIINLSSAGITDDYLPSILQGCKQIKCIDWLNFNNNFLTMVGLENIIHTYSQANQHRKKLGKLTLQGNLQLTYENGYQFIQSFLSIDQINTIPINQLKLEAKQIHSWNLTSQEIRSFELGIICFLLKAFLPHIEEIILANNQLNCKNLHQLLDTVISSLPNCRTIDLSGNQNLTNNGFDLSGILKLQRFLQRSKQLHYVYLDGIPSLPAENFEIIQRSCATNRSLDRTQNNFYFFNDYLKQIIVEKGMEKDLAFQQRQKILSEWQPNPNNIDELFIKRNRLPLCDIQFQFPEDDDEEDEEASAIGDDGSQSIRSASTTSRKEKKKPPTDSGSLMSKISFDGPSDPITSDKIVNGFKLRWIQPKYDENMNLVWRKKGINR